LFQLARSKKACIIFFDEVDAIGGARFDDGSGGDNEVQRTMLQIVTELDGFDARGAVKVLMATNRYFLLMLLLYARSSYSISLLPHFIQT
jgi:26S proteasome regulatory subunit T1